MLIELKTHKIKTLNKLGGAIANPILCVRENKEL